MILNENTGTVASLKIPLICQTTFIACFLFILRHGRAPPPSDIGYVHKFTNAHNRKSWSFSDWWMKKNEWRGNALKMEWGEEENKRKTAWRRHHYILNMKHDTHSLCRIVIMLIFVRFWRTNTRRKPTKRTCAKLVELTWTMLLSSYGSVACWLQLLSS